MASAGRLTGLAYAMIFDEKAVSGFHAQCWWEPQLTLPAADTLRQDLLSMAAWHVRNRAPEDEAIRLLTKGPT